MVRSTECQHKLHRWGEANSVTFDPSKESKHVLSRTDPAGGDFKILGIISDPKLFMASCVQDVCDSITWRIKAILRVQHFHSIEELVLMYKSRVLSIIEYRTSAIYHAASIHLQKIDNLQHRFLRAIGVTEKDALISHHLGPLRTRRDIACWD